MGVLYGNNDGLMQFLSNKSLVILFSTSSQTASLFLALKRAIELIFTAKGWNSLCVTPKIVVV